MRMKVVEERKREKEKKREKKFVDKQSDKAPSIVNVCVYIPCAQGIHTKRGHE